MTRDAPACRRQRVISAGTVVTDGGKGFPMKWIIETVGIVLCVQGVGGALSAIRDWNRSWFLVRYLLPDGAQIPVAVVIALLGAVILLANSRKSENA